MDNDGGRPLVNPLNQLSNTNLTSNQREYKKRLKSELKFLRKVQKLESRISHAISRKDLLVEQQARNDLKVFLSTENSSQVNSQHERLSHGAFLGNRQNIGAMAVYTEATSVITIIFRRLLASLDQACQSESFIKLLQQSKSRNLLQHMTKGTQTVDMFRDVTALRGYVRKKFYGRATLIIESLSRLCPDSLEMVPMKVFDVNANDPWRHQTKLETMRTCWEKLSEVKRVCSIGCGPGNDIVGLISFLHCYFGRKRKLEMDHNGGETTHILEGVMLLDFAMDEWVEAAVGNLIPILVPQYVEKISCDTCDVTKSLFSSGVDVSVPHINATNFDMARFVKNADIFLTSYLLTETRYQWDLFYCQLAKAARTGALFYFAEPMAWQLHRLIRLSSPHYSTSLGSETHETDNPLVDYSPLQRLTYIWIDSSAHHPELQQLDGRAGGPAVLLAVKV